MSLKCGAASCCWCCCPTSPKADESDFRHGFHTSAAKRMRLREPPTRRGCRRSAKTTVANQEPNASSTLSNTRETFLLRMVIAFLLSSTHSQWAPRDVQIKRGKLQARTGKPDAITAREEYPESHSSCVSAGKTSFYQRLDEMSKPISGTGLSDQDPSHVEHTSGQA